MFRLRVVLAFEILPVLPRLLPVSTVLWCHTRVILTTPQEIFFHTSIPSSTGSMVIGGVIFGSIAASFLLSALLPLYIPRRSWLRISVVLIPGLA